MKPLLVFWPVLNVLTIPIIVGILADAAFKSLALSFILEGCTAGVGMIITSRYFPNKETEQP